MPRAAWNKRLTPELEQLIVAHYQAGLSARGVLKLIPFKTSKTVYDVLEKHAVARRRPHGLADYKSHREAGFAPRLDRRQPMYRVTVYSRRMANDLSRYGYLYRGAEIYLERKFALLKGGL